VRPERAALLDRPDPLTLPNELRTAQDLSERTGNRASAFE